MEPKTTADKCKYKNLTDELSPAEMAELPKFLWFETSREEKPFSFWVLLLGVRRVCGQRDFLVSFGGLFTDLDDVTVAVSNAKEKYAEVFKAIIFEYEMGVDDFDNPACVGWQDFPV